MFFFLSSITFSAKFFAKTTSIFLECFRNYPSDEVSERVKEEVIEKVCHKVVGFQ